ncbi:MAG: OXA-48 family carbapenem-hydrolyzing class D beta-lactamase, partial [Shewanella sp.]
MRVLVLSAVLVVASIIGMPATAMEWQENPSWNRHFSEHQAQGVIVLWSENKQQG